MIRSSVSRMSPRSDSYEKLLLASVLSGQKGDEINSRWGSLRTVSALIRKLRLPRQAAIKTLESMNVRNDLLVISSAAEFLHNTVCIQQWLPILKTLFGER